MHLADSAGMKKLTKITAAIIAISSASFIPVYAQTQTTEVQDTRVSPSGNSTTTTTYQISPTDRETIRSYVKKTDKTKLAKGFVRTTTYDEAFPSTWREKVIVGQPLPEVYFERGGYVPEDVIAKMPGQPDRTELIALDGSVIRVEKSSRKVLDVYEVD
jgi:hypothetical protein